MRTWISRRLTLAVGSAAIALLAACGAATTSAPTLAPQPPQDEGGRPSGPPAAAFTIPLYESSDPAFGDRLSLKDLRGKGVVVNFWAPLCPPCRAEMPGFEEAWQELKDKGVVIVGIDVGPYTGLGNKQEALDFLRQINVTYPVGQAESADVVFDYRVSLMPTTVFIRPDGTIARTWNGAIDRGRLVAFALELVQ